MSSVGPRTVTLLARASLRRAAGSRGRCLSSASGRRLRLRPSPLGGLALSSSSASPFSLPGRRPYSSTLPSADGNGDDLPYHLVMGMPALSPTMESGSIASWSLAEGDAFSAGDSLAEIETDKATMAFEAQDDGYIAKILVQAGNGDDVAVNTPIVVVVEEEDDVAAFADFVAPAAAAGAGAPAEAEVAPAAAPSAAPPAAADRDVADAFVLMPSARSISQSAGVDATGLTGTGKGGRVTKGDVLAAMRDGVDMPPLQVQAAAPPAHAHASAAPGPSIAAPVTPADVAIPAVDTASSYEDVPNNNMRKVIAKRLTESKATVPHFYATAEIELDGALALRKRLLADHDVKVSVNDLIIRSAALALRDVPEVNASYDPRTATVSNHPTVDVSVAVATPTGLITPIVPDTDALGLSDISAKVKDLASRARDGKLKPEEYQGGTFCISNLGMFGINEFSAVINPPQAAILAVGGGVRTVVPTPWVDGEDQEGKEGRARPGIRTVMTARLSADRRVVDEATASLFLSALRRYLSQPELLVL